MDKTSSLVSGFAPGPGIGRPRRVARLGHVRDRLHGHAAVVAVVLACAGSPAHADKGVLDRFVGRWEVRVETLRPARSQMVYTEFYRWVLGRQFIHGETERKPDGTQDMVFATYDTQSKRYRFWIFSSSGSYTYLPSATWDARKGVMDWKNPASSEVEYTGRCVFPDEKTRRCTTLLKDWKGKILLEQETTAVRREP